MNAYQAGLLGELRARICVKKRGMKILRTRYRAAGGEIDLIALDGCAVVFIEVKYRPSGRMGEGMEAIGADKRRRMRRAADVYLRTLPEMPSVRYDSLEITRAGIFYLEDAWN